MELSSAPSDERITLRELGMSTRDKRSEEVDDPKPPNDPRPEWSREDQEIEDRKPDLGEIEEDTSEL